MTKNDVFLNSYNALPPGSFFGVFKGARYAITRTLSEDVKRSWLYAEELGGTNYISCNVYFLESGARLKPCEMPEDKVKTFILGVELLA